MEDGTSRREFLRKAVLAGLTIPAVLQGGLETGYAANGPATGATKNGRMKMKRICIEEHWRSPELTEARNQWMVRTKAPLSIDPKATPLVAPRLMDIEKFLFRGFGSNI